jgi:mannose-6-phosphate isomerase
MSLVKDHEFLRRAAENLKGGFIKPSISNLVEAVWGGNRIEAFKGLPTTGKRIGESWECSTHPSHPSMVSLTDGATISLDELLDLAGEDVLGREICREFEGRVPILVKFLDARENLSVQVHPSDEKAAELGETDKGKTEAWVIVGAEPGSFLYLGFRDDVNQKEFEKDLSSKETNIAEKYLNAIPARAGDRLFIPAGTIHAIGKGVFLIEIQQSSGITYRVWDWNREPKRELHIPQAVKSLHFRKAEKTDFEPIFRRMSKKEERLINSFFFSVDRLTLRENDALSAETRGVFQILTCLEGETELAAASSMAMLSQGESVLVPASLERYRILARTSSVLLKSFLPPRKP